MALQKTPVSINFQKGVDTKTDAFQVPIGNFLTLVNSVFDKAGGLTKRNGFGLLSTLPNTAQTTLTTLNDNLLATGSNLYAYSADNDQWFNKGNIQPVNLSVKPLLRANTSQSSPDTAVASNGLVCLVYVDNGVSYFQISDSVTGQQILVRTSIASIDTSYTIGVTPRVFLLSNYFVVTYVATITGVAHLRYIAIPASNPAATLHANDFSTTVVDINAGYDGVVYDNQLYLAWAKDATHVLINALDPSFTKLTTDVTVDSSNTSTLMSLTVDSSTPSNPVIWLSYYDSGTQNGYSAAYTSTLTQLLSPTQTITSVDVHEITSIATASELELLYEVNNVYGGTIGSVKTDYVVAVVCTQAGVVGTPSTMLRSVGLASKAFFGTDGTPYVLVTYGEANQPTYFLCDTEGHILMRLAYSNAGGYAASQVLPSVNALNDVYYVPYLIKDFLASVNKDTNLPSGTPVNGIYTQTGINLAEFSINMSGQHSSEIASALHLTGGQLWEYDGVRPIEHGFHVWPENVASSTSTGAGSIAAGTYYYSFTYEWTDNAGNLHRSAPSIPIKQVTTTSSSTNTLLVPTLRLTAKLSPNPVRIVGYRWSVAQQTYYQFTSLTSPTLNDTTVDYVTITDTLADSSILGNVLLYTTGGVLENIAAPASTASVLFKNRLFLVDAEDPNLLWYSKQVLEGVPIEMSDLLTIYVAPSTGTQGSTGPILALGALDDKLIVFKRDAIYYITGNGPDVTGANNDFSDPIFVTSSVGCANPNSVVLMPNGIMFQSDKGIWLLGRDLSTNYIGAPVEGFNSATVLSASTIPDTNQVRFILDTNVILMYDFYYGQWGTFTSNHAISATLYNSRHTYLNSYGQILQETPNQYLDGSAPVLMSFTTSWISLAGLQGYERFYEALLLGKYYTPFKLNVSFAFDYNSSAEQATIVSPDNFSPAWGGEAAWGTGGSWGGPGLPFEARIFPNKQKCETFQVKVEELYDPYLTPSLPAGQGVSLSGLDLLVGIKRAHRTQKASRSFG